MEKNKGVGFRGEGSVSRCYERCGKEMSGESRLSVVQTEGSQASNCPLRKGLAAPGINRHSLVDKSPGEQIL